MVNTIETVGIETQVDLVAHSYTRHYPHLSRVNIISMKNSPFLYFHQQITHSVSPTPATNDGGEFNYLWDFQ